mgnify:CR=1 FL=1
MEAAAASTAGSVHDAGGAPSVTALPFALVLLLPPLPPLPPLLSVLAAVVLLTAGGALVATTAGLCLFGGGRGGGGMGGRDWLGRRPELRRRERVDTTTPTGGGMSTLEWRR